MLFIWNTFSIFAKKVSWLKQLISQEKGGEWAVFPNLHTFHSRV